MITPISSNLECKRNLEPVKVPHFTGMTKVAKSKDSFENSCAQAKKNAKHAAQTFKGGIVKGAKKVKDGVCTAVSFLGSFFSSLIHDSADIAKKKAMNPIDNAVNATGAIF